MAEALLSRLSDAVRLVTLTTRTPRVGEQNGEHYTFVTVQEFNQKIDSGELFEHAEVYGNLYGSSRLTLEQLLSSHKFVLAVVDVQGAVTMKEKIPSAFVLFVKPSSLSDIERRLRTERPDSSLEDITRRLETAQKEMAIAKQFDATLDNIEGQFDAMVERALSLLEKN